MLATWRGRFVCAFLLIQLLLPLHYYLLRRDPHDERFAWRMFSPTRMARCSLSLTVNREPVAVDTRFHEAWIGLAERGRLAVVEAMATKLCEDHPGARVTASLDCTYVDRAPHRYAGNDMCQVPRL
jgi:hypothetical protein